MAIAGNSAVVRIGTNVISSITTADLSTDSNQVEITALGDNWRDYISTINGATISMSGFYDPADTDGQVVLRDAYLNRTQVADVRWLVDGSVGFSSTVNVSAMSFSVSFDGAVEITFDLQVVGALTAV